MVHLEVCACAENDKREVASRSKRAWDRIISTFRN
jgi:hypothetical protein